MKKTLKKLTALTLAFMLLFTLSAVQASAGLFDKIESALPQNASVTARELDEYISDMDEYGWEDEEDYLYYFYPEFLVTLTTGEVISTNENGYGYSENGKRVVDLFCYLDVRDYLEAKEKGEDKVVFSYEIYLYSSINIQMDYITGGGVADIVDCYVKELRPVSDLPDTYHEVGLIYSVLGDLNLPEMKEYDLEGLVFDVVYPDGSVERGTVEVVYDDDGDEYYELNGEEIYYYLPYDEEDVLYIIYGDYSLEHPVEYIPFPVEEIVIDDIQVTDDFNAESVTYTITKPDGTTQSYTYNFDSSPVTTVLGAEGYMAESVDDAYIIVLVSKGYTEDYPSKELIEVMVFADVMAMDVESVEGEAQEDNLLNRLIYKIRMFFTRILEFFLYL